MLGGRCESRQGDSVQRVDSQLAACPDARLGAAQAKPICRLSLELREGRVCSCPPYSELLLLTARHGLMGEATAITRVSSTLPAHAGKSGPRARGFIALSSHHSFKSVGSYLEQLRFSDLL